MKKFLSVLLCLVLVVSAAVCVIPADAASSNNGTGYNQKTPLESEDDFTWDNASVYFLMTDRFQNGNTSNDHSYGRTLDANGQPISGWNTSPGTFHGGDFAGITQKINEGYFDDLGVNALWISAPYEQIHGYVTPGEGNDFAHYSYHGYYVLDYTETDANFGTKEEFRTMVDTAHSHGIRIVMDIVMNHAGYNTLLDMTQYNFGTITDREGADSYIHRITDVNGLHDTVDYKSSAEDWGRWWGADWVRSGLPGYNEGGGSDETRSLAGLPDFKTEQSSSVSLPPILQNKWQKEGTYNAKVSKYGSSDTVSNYIVKWLSEWVSTYGVDGFRCDTAKHVEKASWNKLKTSCVSALKNWRQNNSTKPGADWQDDFWMTGEHWDYKLGYGSYYTEGGFDSMINFSFSGSGVPGVSGINGTYQHYADTINNQENFNALTYISSHDSDLARGDLIYQGSAFQLLPGAIQIFYGDETNRSTVAGMSFDGHGGSGHSLRSDMNWNSIDQNVLKHWQKVGRFRNKHVCIGAGQHQQISAYSANSGYTFMRSYDNGEMADSVICVIGAPKNTQIPVKVSSIWGNGKTVTNYYDGSTAVVQDGKAVFNSGENGTILIEGPQPTIHMSLKGAYAFYDSETVTVSLRGADYAMVSVNGGSQFRVTDGQTFEIGEGIEVGTVFEVAMSATNAIETLEKSFTFKKKDPNAITTIYFDNSRYRWSNVYAYVYDESSGSVVQNEKWPGKLMTYDENLGLYKYEVEDELTNGLVIFNAGSDANKYPRGDKAKGLEINETNMILLAGDRWEPYTGQTPEGTTPVNPAEMITVYFDNTSSNFETPYIYYWHSSTNSGDISWPGIAMTKYKDNVYKASFPNDNDMCIFSNNGHSKTGDLKIPGADMIYDGNEWRIYADAEVPTGTSPTSPTSSTIPSGSSYYGDADTDGKVNINDVTAIQLHLIRARLLSELGAVLANVDYNTKVSIQDANTIQCVLVGVNTRANCVNQLYSGDSQETETSATSATQSSKRVVYFRNAYNWSPMKAYFWSDENKNMMSWPGVDMVNVSGNIFSAEVPDGATKVIFTEGSWRSQTGDLTIPDTSMIFDIETNSWSDYTG